MPYSKRWELVHLLGGKCVDCGNENFYDLEIDHINNDGDGERKYYTLSEKNYLANPSKAKERLAVRCKICHEKRHSGASFNIERDDYQQVGVFPAKDGKICGHGTWLEDGIKEVLIMKLGDGKAKKLLRHVIF